MNNQEAIIFLKISESKEYKWFCLLSNKATYTVEKYISDKFPNSDNLFLVAYNIFGIKTKVNDSGFIDNQQIIALIS